MSSFVEFLAARLDEDEAVARGASTPPDLPETWAVEPPFDPTVKGDARLTGLWLEVGDTCAPGYVDPDQAVHIARHDPARVVSEVAAKRRIAAMHPGEWNDSPHIDNDAFICTTCHEVWPCETLALIASAYADHPDYRAAWKP